MAFLHETNRRMFNVFFFFQKCLFCIYLFFFLGVLSLAKDGKESVTGSDYVRMSRDVERAVGSAGSCPGYVLEQNPPPPLSTPNPPCLFSFLSSWLDHGILIEFWKKATKTKKNIYKHKKEILVLRSTISFNPQFVCFFQIKNPPSILYITYV